MSTVDIVIPVYNQSRALIECLKCLRLQTFQDFQVIIVDDGSTDGVENTVQLFLRAQNIQTKNFREELSTKTRFIRQKHQGASIARNTGATLSRAEYILFCDADVIPNKNLIKYTLQTLKNNPNKSYSYTSFKYGWKKFKLWKFSGETLKKMPYIHTTSLIRRAHFPGFDPALKKFQDWDLWLTMLEHGYEGIWIPKYLFSVRPGGTMSKWVPKFFYRYFRKNKNVQEYRQGMEIIQKKHHLV